MTFKLGLTGSIGMGKSTTAQMFVEEGCALWDADAAVHRLYAKGGAAVKPMGERFPSAILNDAVSRDILKDLISEDEANLKRIEQVVHPLVSKDRKDFLDTSEADITVVDIPLLFETGSDKEMDAVVVVTVNAQEQMRRVLERGSMTKEQIETIIEMQTPDEEKRRRADFVIETDTLAHAQQQVKSIVEAIRARLDNA